MLGEIIRQKRKELGLTQLDLADQLNISILKLATWEADEDIPTDEQFILLSKIFECPITELTDKPIEVKESLISEQPEIMEEPTFSDEFNFKEEIDIEETSIESDSIINEIEEAHDINKDGSKPIISPNGVIKKKLLICKKCYKVLNQTDEFVEIPYFDLGHKKIILCKKCSFIAEEEANKKVLEVRKNLYFKYIKQALLCIAFWLFYVIFILTAAIVALVKGPKITNTFPYIYVFIFLGLILMIPSYITLLCLDNIHVYSACKQRIYDSRYLEKSKAAVKEYIFLTITVIFLFILSVIFLPIAIIKLLYTGNKRVFMKQKGAVIKANYYASLETNYQEAKAKYKKEKETK